MEMAYIIFVYSVFIKYTIPLNLFLSLQVQSVVVVPKYNKSIINIVGVYYIFAGKIFLTLCQVITVDLNT